MMIRKHVYSIFKTMKLAVAMVSLLCFSSLRGSGQVKLPAIISNNMVLQQSSSVPLWGKAKPGVQIKVKPSWQKETVTTRASQDSSWKVNINTPVAGGPYAIEINDGVPLKITNVLIGEVWLCSGQSNMTMPVKGFPNDPVKGSTEEILHAKNKSIRFFDVGRSSSLELQKDVKGSWKEVNSENLANFSATAWFFGKTVQENLEIPVGLITSSWGGSNIETWMSKATLTAFPEIKIPVVKDSIKIPNQTPTILFNNMIYPIVGYGIKGVIWYQGESNRLKPGQYTELLPALVKNWRSLWG
ncbi:MAG: sialate O-acetylesterase, partial [Pedobacter sp.]